MIKVEVYDENKTNVEDGTLRLALRNNARGVVEVIAVNAQGEEYSGGSILAEFVNGKLEIWDYVDPEAPISRTGYGRIALTKEVCSYP